MATNVPKIQFTPNGIVLPQESDILAGVQSDINTAFGGGVNPQLSSPQGQVAQSDTAIIGDKNDEFAYLANQFNPDFASGRWQDAIGRIYYLTRIPANGTVVTATCTGAVGTVIPAGSLAQDTNGYLYSLTSALTIPATGSIDGQFQNTTTGPIACASGALSKIYSSIIGWDSVLNASAGALGNNVETRAEFEYRRRNSVAINAQNSNQAVYANVLAVAGVLDAYVWDNSSAVTVNHGATNYPVPRNSIVISVAGGAAADVAQAIWNKKNPGCGYAGNTTYDIQDTVGYAQPYPTYTVKWLTPTPTPTYFAVQIADNDLLPADIVTQVKNAIISAFSGDTSDIKARIGSRIYVGPYYAVVGDVNENVQVISVFMSTSSGSVTGTSIYYGIDQLPTIDAANITVTLV